MSPPAARDPALPPETVSVASTSADGWPAWRRVAIGGGGGMFVGMGLGRFSYTAMVPALISSGELTALEAGRVGTLNIAGFAFGALISVPLRSRLEEYPVLVTAICLSVVALLASAAPLGFAWLGFWRCIVGITAGVIMVLSLALIAATAPAARRPVAASFVFAGVGLGILSAGTLVPLLLANSLSAAWLGLGGCAIAAALAAIWGWRAAPAHQSPPMVSEPAAGHIVGAASPWNTPLRLLLLGHLCFSMAIVPHTLYWVDYIARGLGQGIGEGGFHWSLVGIASILGPWIAAWLGLMLGTGWALAVSFLALGIGIAAPLVSSATIVLLASSLLFGAQPGLSALMAARTRDLAEADNMPRLMRAMILTSSLGAIAAGLVLPQIYDATQSHVLIFALGGASMILGAVLVAPWGKR
jgi:predicted MFS family arabinose efflux permease